MQSDMWLAGLFGPYLLILGVWGLFYRDNMMKVFSSIKANPGILYVLGIFNLFLGLVIVNTYSTWAADAMVLVTLLGWALIVHGASCLFLPQVVLKAKSRTSKKVSLRAVVALVWGLALCWLAFWMH